MTRHFSKTVNVVEKDDDEQVAISAVLVPNEVDHQLDWFAPEDVERAFNPDADIGVMHAVFPDGAAESEHYLLEEPETFGGEEYPAGTWIEERHYDDPDLWQLVKDGVLAGRSIGGRVPEDAEETYAPDELPAEVSYGPGVPTGESTTRIRDSEIDEVSDVDTPAVPRAEMAVVKSLGKNIMADVDGEEEFVEVMRGRGHSEEDARRLWDYMQSVESAKTKQELDPEVKDCKDSVLEDNPGMSESEAIAICRDQLGKDESKANDAGGNSGVESDTNNAMSNSDTTDDESADKSLDEVDDATLGARLKSVLGFGGTADDEAEAAKSDAADDGDDAEKAGRTLSSRNIALAKEMHDDAEHLLQDAGVDRHSPAARTYHEDKNDDYERGDHGAYADADKATDADGPAESAESAAKEMTAEEASQAVAGVILGGDTRDALLDGLAAEDGIDGIDDNRDVASGVVDSVLEARVEIVDERLGEEDGDADDHEAAADTEDVSDDETKAAESAADILSDVDEDRLGDVLDKVNDIATHD